jgi:hypothetical protein
VTAHPIVVIGALTIGVVSAISWLLWFWNRRR